MHCIVRLSEKNGTLISNLDNCFMCYVCMYVCMYIESVVFGSKYVVLYVSIHVCVVAYKLPTLTFYLIGIFYSLFACVLNNAVFHLVGHGIEPAQVPLASKGDQRA